MGGGAVEARISPSRIFISNIDRILFDGPFNPSVSIAGTAANAQIFFPGATPEELYAISEEFAMAGVQTDDFDYEEGVAYIGLAPEADDWSVTFNGNTDFAPFSLQVSVI